MNSENPVFSHIHAIKTSIVNKQITEGKLLSDRFFSLIASFRGFNDPNFDLQENQNLLTDLLEFEKNICSLEFLYMFYGYIGRMYLQNGDMEKAVMYGQAGLELSIKIDDQEGVVASYNLLCDCSIASDAALIAVEYFKKAQPNSIDQIEFLKTMPNHNAEKVSKVLARKTRPSTYKHFNSEDAQHKEESIRFLMVAQGYSRATASKYIESPQASI